MIYFIKKILIAIIIGAIWILAIGIFVENLLASIAMRDFSDLLSEFIIAAVTTIIFLIYLWTARCKKCRKFFSYRKVGTEMVNSEDISIKVKLNDYNTRNEVSGTHEQYIAGTRDTYRTCYRCKNCGNEFYKRFSKETKKV